MWNILVAILDQYQKIWSKHFIMTNTAQSNKSERKLQPFKTNVVNNTTKFGSL